MIGQVRAEQTFGDVGDEQTTVALPVTRAAVTVKREYAIETAQVVGWLASENGFFNDMCSPF